MMRVRVYKEAVRYLYALAKYNNDEVSRKIVDITSAGSKNAGYVELVETPYSTKNITYYPINKTIEKLNSVSPSWVKLVMTLKGREVILKLLTTNYLEPDDEEGEIRKAKICLVTDNSATSFILGRRNFYSICREDEKFTKDFNKMIEQY